MSKLNQVKISKELLFQKDLENIFPDNYKDILKCHLEPGYKSFRIIKGANESEVLKSLENEGFKIKKSTIPNAFSVISSKDKKLSESSANVSHEIYIQGLSSMLPVLALHLKPSDKVLDLCAAPGSKTLQLLEILGEENVVANEISKNRIYKLRDNLADFGYKNIQITNFDGVMMPFKQSQFLEHFDAILVDAPCSNQANIDLNNPKTYMNWNPKKSKSLGKLQKGLLNSAFKMLKPGGSIIYSTCTYSVTENEAVVNWFLNKNRNSKIEEPNFGFDLNNILTGYNSYRDKSFDESLNKTLRILPNKYFKGFYLAKIVKSLNMVSPLSKG